MTRIIPHITMAQRPPPAPDSRLPRYLQIRDELMRRICARAWTEGQALPAEDKLAAEFGVALGTLRKALEALVADGIVERVHGRGTFVSRAFERISMLRFVGFSLAEAGRTPDTATLAIEVAPASPELCARLQLAPGSHALYLHRTRSADGEVLLSEHVWLPHKPFQKLEAHLRAHDVPLLYPVYDAVCGVLVSQAADELSAVPLPAADARLLKCPKGSLGIRIERRMSDPAGRPIEWRVAYVRPDRFRYAVETR